MNALLVDKIFENIKRNDIHDGCLIASISKSNPNYYYHWTRDAALVMRTLVRHYRKNNDLICFKQIIDYVKVESYFQNLPTLGGIGEPKFHVDLTAYNESWGRPQNDGPALRGLVMLEIMENLNEYNFLLVEIRNILGKDLRYILDNINQPCFDLWEEVYGYHLYTRGVQYKFLKEIENKNIFPELQAEISNKKRELWNLIQHHQITATSFNIEGQKCREYDTSLLLLVSHVDYDLEVVDITQPHFIDYVKKMVSYYENEYYINSTFSGNMILLGRYKEDQYFRGNPWIICTASLYQLIVKFKELKINLDATNFNYDISLFQKYINTFPNLELPEQLDKYSGYSKSALRLTWNYSELIVLETMFYDYIHLY